MSSKVAAPASADGQPSVEASAPTAAIGWARGIGSGLVIVLVGFGLAAYLPDLLLNQLGGLDRHLRVAIATTVCFASVLVLAVVLRRLQARRLI